MPRSPARITLFLLLLFVLAGLAAPSVRATAFRTPADLGEIDAIAQRDVDAGHVPGAVIEIGQADAVLYRHAFGARTTGPDAEPMTVDTVFDLASLTKVVATTTAVLQQVERGTLSLEQPASRYWPQFAAHGKSAITVRALLTHYSGLRPDLDLRRRWTGYRSAMQLLADERPIANPGSRYVYSDENFAVLGEIVRRASGLPLDVYSRRRVFEPLGMTNTRFRPPASVAEPIIAPTMLRVATGARVAVNDPMAERMGGVSGHAGVFSTAGDLGRFARMWLRGGELDGVRVLQRATVGLAVTPWTPAPDARPRGLGWDVANGMSSVELPAGSYGHTGYTGTLIWIDPASQTYVVILTNRTYPDGRGNAQPLRDAVLQTLFGR